MRALIVIDYTNDFVAADGRLTCGAAGQSIERRITELCREFVAAGDQVVFAIDVHDENDPFHPETKLFPKHNIRGTEGRHLYGQLGEYFETIRNDRNVHWMDKTRYSAFAGTDLTLLLNARGIKEVHLAGVCTDICVLHTAVDAYNQAYELYIHEDAVQSFNQAGHEWAIEHFRSCLGAQVKHANRS